MTSIVLGMTLAISSIGHATELPVFGMPAVSDRQANTMQASATNVGAGDRDIRVMLGALNAQRASHKLGPLRLDPNLCRIARGFANDMATRSFFSHRSPEGQTPFNRMDHAHYRYGYAGENIALDRDPHAASEALWHSSAHRENILEPHYLKVGIGAIRAANGEIFVEDFSD